MSLKPLYTLVGKDSILPKEMSDRFKELWKYELDYMKSGRLQASAYDAGNNDMVFIVDADYPDRLANRRVYVYNSVLRINRTLNIKFSNNPTCCGVGHVGAWGYSDVAIPKEIGELCGQWVIDNMKGSRYGLVEGTFIKNGNAKRPHYCKELYDGFIVAGAKSVAQFKNPVSGSLLETVIFSNV